MKTIIRLCCCIGVVVVFCFGSFVAAKNSESNEYRDMKKEVVHAVAKESLHVDADAFTRDAAAQEIWSTTLETVSVTSQETASVIIPETATVNASGDSQNLTVSETSNNSNTTTDTSSETVASNVKSHGVSVSHAKIYRPYTDQFSETMSLIRSDTTQFDKSHIQSLAEIDYILLGSIGISTPTAESLGGPITGVMIKDEYISMTKSAVQDFDAAQSRYQSYIKNALYGMDLSCTDKEMVDQINAYIVRNFSYSVTNDEFMSSFTDGRTGQCMHYARLFSDMCEAVGISCSYIEGYANGEYHAFNSVTIAGQKYYFDVSWSDVCGDRNAYSWLSESQLRQTHSW